MTSEAQDKASDPAQHLAVRSSNAVVHQTRCHQWHFGLLDVPQPEDLNSAGANQLGESKDLILPRQNTEQLSPGSERSKDAAVVTARLGSRQSLDPCLEECKPNSEQTASQPIRPRPFLPTDTSQRKGQSPKELRSISAHGIPSDGLGSGGLKAAFAASMPGVSASHLEGSATSDENNQPRLVPRKGAGPDLRTQGGSKIDEYLMKLLRTGAPQPASDLRHAQTHGAVQQLGQSRSGQTGVTPSPATTWQGSRLGPLAPGAGTRSSAVSRQTAPAVIATEKPKHTSPSRQPAEPLIKKDALTQAACKLPGGCEEATLRKKKHGGEPAADVGCEVEAAQGRAANDDQDEDRTAEPPALDMTKSKLAVSGMLHRVQEALGVCNWDKLKGTIQSQSQEFQHQLQELHRVATMQNQLQNQLKGHADVGAVPGQALGRHPPLFVQHSTQAAVTPSPFKQPLLPIPAQGPSWWHGVFPSQTAGIEADSIARPHAQAKESGRLSRTTQIALEAQRRRSKLRLTELSAQEQASSRQAADQAASVSGASEGKPPLQSARQPPQHQQQLPWFSLIAPALMQANQAAGQLPVPASSMPQASNGAAVQPLSGSLGASALTDPLSAWYTFHFGQQPSFGAGGIGPIAAQYSMQLAGLAMAQSEGGWEKHCHKYFNFSLPASSEATCPTSRDPTAQGWQGVSAASQGQKRSRSMAMEEAPRGLNHSNSIGRDLSETARGLEWEGGLAALENAARQVALASNRSPNGNSGSQVQRAN